MQTRRARGLQCSHLVRQPNSLKTPKSAAPPARLAGAERRQVHRAVAREGWSPAKGGMIIAQGKRGTSAALGCGWKMIFFLFFKSGLARHPARQTGFEKKKGWVWGRLDPGPRPACASRQRALP